jgi:hypothetical protein
MEREKMTYLDKRSKIRRLVQCLTGAMATRATQVAYIAMRKIYYNVMRFRDTLSVDEAKALASSFR